MDFGKVLESMKIDARNRFRRTGWNGKGMYIYLTKGRDIPVEKWTGGGDPVVRNGMVTIGSHIDMVDANGNVVVGWLASQTDMLAEDWERVE